MKTQFAIALLAAGLMLCSRTITLAQSPTPPGVLKSEFIYETAPFPSCHASTIAETTKGRSSPRGSVGSTKNIRPSACGFSRQVEGRWTAPVEVANGVQYSKPDGAVHRHPCWNPVLFQPKSGPLMLFYKVGPSPSTWWGMFDDQRRRRRDMVHSSQITGAHRRSREEQAGATSERRFAVRLQHRARRLASSLRADQRSRQDMAAHRAGQRRPRVSVRFSRASCFSAATNCWLSDGRSKARSFKSPPTTWAAPGGR